MCLNSRHGLVGVSGSLGGTHCQGSSSRDNAHDSIEVAVWGQETVDAIHPINNNFSFKQTIYSNRSYCYSIQTW